ncbi:MAG: hypothetical protein R3Y61_07605, partial [Rikenellaceae bacterium]
MFVLGLDFEVRFLGVGVCGIFDSFFGVILTPTPPLALHSLSSVSHPFFIRVKAACHRPNAGLAVSPETRLQC